MSFRMGLLIGGLAVAVVALVVAVILLATGGSSDDSSTTAATESGASCLVSQSGAPAELDLSASGLECAEGKAVIAEYQLAVAREEGMGIGLATEVSGWKCETLALAEYPTLARCRSNHDRLDVLGTAPSAHPNMGPPPTSTDVRAARRRGQTKPVVFQTPSGNIGCSMSQTEVLCSIFKFNWSPPPVPADCEFPGSEAWGHTIQLTPHGHTFLCSDQAVISPGGKSDFQTLHYGDGIAVGPFGCESREQALVCVTKSGQGILLSVQKLSLF